MPRPLLHPGAMRNSTWNTKSANVRRSYQESESLTRADEIPILDRPDRQRPPVLHKLFDPLGHPAVQVLAVEKLDLIGKTHRGGQKHRDERGEPGHIHRSMYR